MGLAEVDVGEEAAPALCREPGGHGARDAVGGARGLIAPHLVELGEAAVEPVEAAGDRVGDEARGVDALRGQQLGEGQAVRGQARGERHLRVVAVGILRRPHRGHRAQRVDGGREHALEHDPFAGQAVDVRRGGTAVAVGAEVIGAAGVEHDEQDVRAAEAGAQRIRAAALVFGRRRAHASALRLAPASEHARRASTAPRRSDPPSPPPAPRAGPGARCRPPCLAAAPALPDGRGGLRAEGGRPELPLLARTRLLRHAEGRGRARRARPGVQVRREAELRGGGQADRVAHDARPDLDQRGHAVRPRDRERPRRVAREQVLQAGVAGIPDGQAVERGGELPAIGVARIVRRRRRRREHEPQAVVARFLGGGGNVEAVSIAGVVERPSRDGRPVEQDLHRLALHPLVGREVYDGGPRPRGGPGERKLGLSLRPHEGVPVRGRRLAVEAVRLLRLRGRRAEQENGPRRPALGVGEPFREVVGDLPRDARAAQGKGAGGKDAGDEKEDGSGAARSPMHALFRRRYRTFVPRGTSASKVQSTALPSTDPARTIPFDSTPISFAALRFETSTIVLPTSDSGV